MPNGAPLDDRILLLAAGGSEGYGGLAQRAAALTFSIAMCHGVLKCSGTPATRIVIRISPKSSQGTRTALNEIVFFCGFCKATIKTRDEPHNLRSLPPKLAA